MSTDSDNHHQRRIGELESELLKALQRIAELESERIELEKAAHEDPLTAVLNRRGFENRLQAIAAVSERNPESLKYVKPYFIAVDLDHFKSINDRHGHETGDLVLKEFAKILTHSVRDYDLVARFGGEEFTIALVDVGSAEAKQKAESIAKAVRTHQFSSGGQIIKVTASFGLSANIKSADKALYQAKKQGRDRVVVAD